MEGRVSSVYPVPSLPAAYECGDYVVHVHARTWSRSKEAESKAAVYAVRVCHFFSVFSEVDTTDWPADRR